MSSPANTQSTFTSEYVEEQLPYTQGTYIAQEAPKNQFCEVHLWLSYILRHDVIGIGRKTDLAFFEIIGPWRKLQEESPEGDQGDQGVCL